MTEQTKAAAHPARVWIGPVDGCPPGPPMSVSLRSTRELATGHWRTFRPVYVTPASPCNLDCPAGTDVRAFLARAAEGDAEGAWRIIRAHNPLPGVCGRVCYHPCERACNRLALDEPVAIHAVERAVADEARRQGWSVAEAGGGPGAAVAVVGAGPAGLTAAYHLARRGHRVTVFDAMPQPGGMLRYGIPAYRLPRDVLDAEIDLLRALGIRFVGGVRIGAGGAADALQGFAAIFVAIGAQRSRRVGVPGEALEGVRSGVEFLREVNAGTASPLAGRAVVIGGGNTALDTARAALRLGATPTIVYRRAREDMPAHPDEIAQAEAEGIAFIFHAAPVRFVERGGRLGAVEFQRMRPGEPDATGRRRPEPIPGSSFELSAEYAFTAVGEDVETAVVADLVDAVNGRLRADRWGRTERPAVFAGGDAATGAGTVVEAIGSGRRAAEAIDAWLRGAAPSEPTEAVRVGPERLNLFYFRRVVRARPPLVAPARAVRDFTEVVQSLAWHEAAAEAARCFSCGACTQCDNCLVFCPDAAIARDGATGGYRIDLAHCKGCGICAAECPRGALTLVPEAR
jgi:NADPH-dependent glutamate synthase beta subunit-like oxidoreductase